MNLVLTAKRLGLCFENIQTAMDHGEAPFSTQAPLLFELQLLCWVQWRHLDRECGWHHMEKEVVANTRAQVGVPNFTAVLPYEMAIQMPQGIHSSNFLIDEKFT